MTSRTTPVGVLVTVLVGIIAIGCTAQTSAVFEALLDPARAPVSTSGGEAAGGGIDDGSADGWWPLPDGYQMALPAGWSGISVSAAQARELVNAIAATHPGLAGRVDRVLGATGSQVSMVAVDTNADGEMPPMLVVLSQSTDGRKARVVKTRTYDQISSLPGLRGAVVHDDARLANASGVRYDYFVDDADLGSLQVRSFLFRYARQAFLVSFIARESAFDDAELVFDVIADSLRFGV